MKIQSGKEDKLRKNRMKNETNEERCRDWSQQRTTEAVVQA